MKSEIFLHISFDNKNNNHNDIFLLTKNNSIDVLNEKIKNSLFNDLISSSDILTKLVDNFLFDKFCNNYYFTINTDFLITKKITIDNGAENKLYESLESFINKLSELINQKNIVIIKMPKSIAHLNREQLENNTVKFLESYHLNNSLENQLENTNLNNTNNQSKKNKI